MKLIELVKAQLSLFSEQWKEKSYLLATSGGGDSMALLHLFNQLGLDVTVAHVNFNLRGQESDEDQAFVESVCSELSIPYYVHSANTKQYVQENALSTQEAAREIRYKWFDQLATQHSLDCIVTAHHGNDSIETFFINLLRGAGIKGLSGIPVQNGKIIRPLLSAKKEAITDYLNQQSIPFREDSSNTSEKYLRNNLRHKLLPTLLDIDPNAKSSILQSIQHLSVTNTYLEKKIQEDILKISSVKGGCTYINTQYPIDLIVLLKLLSKFNFSVAQISNFHEQSKQVGSILQSPSHKLLVDRDKWIIKPTILTDDKESYTFDNYGAFTKPFPIQFKLVGHTEKYSKSKSIELLDANLISFPLTLRRWEKGDSFTPLGMKHQKKLSDFFIDQKLSRFQKESCWILTDSKRIIWVVGHRINDIVKTTPSTKKVLKIETQLEILP